MFGLVSHLVEFQKQYGDRANALNYYHKLPQFLHEMTADDLVSEINRNGEGARLGQQAIIFLYLRWLSDNYGVQVNQLYYELRQKLDGDSGNQVFIGFYSIDEMTQAMNDAELTIESTGSKNADWSGLYALFYLEWYGVSVKSALTIKISDVSDDGKTVYIPQEDKTIQIDNPIVSTYFAKYKQKTGYIPVSSEKSKTSKERKERPYTQNTFIRNTSHRKTPITVKSIYNVQGIFARGSGDKRFEKNNVFDSGRYYALYQQELQNNEELTIENRDIFYSVFNDKTMSDNVIRAKLREYKAFKQSLIKRL